MGRPIYHLHPRTDPILSVCIPSYERPDYLRYTLNQLRRITLPIEVIISDDSAIYRCPELNRNERYNHQNLKLGAFPNKHWVLTQAKTKYAVYCADDDYLIEYELRRAIRYMEDHPDCAAYCAPCEIYDEVNHKPYWNAFKVKESSYSFSDGIGLFNLLIESHIWPEHIVYRTPVPLKPPTRAYWAFADLADILSVGSIHFDPEPFYRNLLVHPVGLREQLGNVQCLTFFDEYRAGLEVLAYDLFGEQPYKARHQIQEMIGQFICARMDKASQMLWAQGKKEEAIMLRKRIAIARADRDTIEKEVANA
jgi:glycosyltransferase involved in cell wall biosynthesis